MKIKLRYTELDAKLDIVGIQDKVLGFWTRIIYSKILLEKKGGEVVFYDIT